MNKLVLIFCVFFFVNGSLFSQCYEPFRNDGISFYNKADYLKALNCFMAAKRCPDKPANHDLDKRIADCNTKLNAPVTSSKETTPKKTQVSPAEKKEEPKNEPPKSDRAACYVPLFKAAQISFLSKNFSEAKDLYNEARKCYDLPADNGLALWIKMCDDEIAFQNCIKNSYTPFYTKGNDLLNKENFEKAKELFFTAKQSECKPDHSDVDAKIDICEQKIKEKRFNTLLQDTIKFTLWGKEGIFMGYVQYGKPNGKGIFLFTKDQSLKSIETHFINGEPVGSIHCVFNNQDEFIGTLKEDDFENGTYKYANGEVYKGSFIQRIPNGEGTITYSNGNIYTGNIVNGKKEGVGKLIVHSENYIPNTQGAKIYDGNWLANQKWGFGKCFDEQGTLIHDGVFTNDFPEKDYPNRVMRIPFTWVKVPAGSFTMGCTFSRDCTDKDRPARVVTLSEFHISDKEVTVAQYRAFCEATGRSVPQKPSWGWEEDNPIVNITWNDAVAFCQWNNCRLPTEAEWEYAAQGALEPRTKLYSGSNELREVAYFKDNSQRTRTVAKRKPNELLIYDMSGNVSEWVQDWHGNYPQISQQDPKGPSSGFEKVVRGGNWHSDEIECRVTYRGTCEPNLYTNYIGFRVVRNW